MNEPQLSAEMERRFSAIMLEWIESQWKIEQAHQNGEPYTRMKFEADASKVEDKLQHFLATALEEEREKVLSEVNEAVTQRVLPAPLLGHYTEDRLHQRWQVELNQLKGGE